MGRSEKSGLFFARSRLKLPGTRNPGLRFAIANIAAATTFHNCIIDGAFWLRTWICGGTIPALMRELGLFSLRLKCLLKRVVLVTTCVSALMPLFSSDLQAQLSARTLGRSLDQLVGESELIVRGSVVSSSVEPHPELRNLMTVVVAMSVSDTYKGRPQKSLIFRQYIGSINGRIVPSEYRKGEELLLLLRPVSEYGLTSPAGLEQGRFDVRFHNGNKVAVNGRGNVGLFDQVFERTGGRVQLSPRASTLVKQRRPGLVPLADLEDLIRTLARAQ